MTAFTSQSFPKHENYHNHAVTICRQYVYSLCLHPLVGKKDLLQSSVSACAAVRQLWKWQSGRESLPASQLTSIDL